jgi:hypothetical protein
MTNLVMGTGLFIEQKGIWHDMAIERSNNYKDCGKYRHLCAKEEALQKYYWTAN